MSLGLRKIYIKQGMNMNIMSTHEIKPEVMLMQRVGERMMDMGCKLDDHKKANMYSVVGNLLANAGTLFVRRYEDFTDEEKKCVSEVARSMGIKC